MFAVLIKLSKGEIVQYLPSLDLMFKQVTDQTTIMAIHMLNNCKISLDDISEQPFKIL